jgi:hypothetical protein
MTQGTRHPQLANAVWGRKVYWTLDDENPVERLLTNTDGIIKTIQL